MSSKTKKPAGKAQRSAIADVVAREYTIHLHKRVCLSIRLDDKAMPRHAGARFGLWN